MVSSVVVICSTILIYKEKIDRINIGPLLILGGIIDISCAFIIFVLG